MQKTQTRVVILGAGFGGLSVARLLARSRIHRHCAITLVDERADSIYTPWLHEIAAGTTGSTAIHDADIPLESVRGVRFRRATVEGIDRTHRHVLCADGSTVPYDILVCALGTISNHFEIPGVKAFTLDLKRTSDAIAIRERFSECVARAKQGTRQRVFVVGTGANGIELAAECAASVRALVQQKIIANDVLSVHVAGATSEILPMLSPSLRARAMRRLERLGVILHRSVALKEVREGVLTLQPMHDGLPNGALRQESFALCVTALGVKVPDVVQSLGVPVNERGRILVDDTLRVRGEIAVFALGDSAVRDHGTPDPQTAQAAVRQAATVARNIRALMNKRPLVKYRSRARWPIIITLGMHDAIASLFGVPIWGYTVAILRRVIDARYFLLATSWRETFMRMGRGFLTYGKSNDVEPQNVARERRARR